MTAYLTEAQLSEQVTALADLCGWRWTHFRPARTAQGWRTPVSGAPGFPDLVLVRGTRLVFAELKSARGRPSPEQRIWLDLLGRTSAEVYVWTPSDWTTIHECLTRPDWSQS